MNVSHLVNVEQVNESKSDWMGECEGVETSVWVNEWMDEWMNEAVGL